MEQLRAVSVLPAKSKLPYNSISDFYFFQTYGADYNLLAAGAMIGLAPVVIIFVLFQNQFVKGLSSGGVKG